MTGAHEMLGALEQALGSHRNLTAIAWAGLAYR